MVPTNNFKFFIFIAAAAIAPVISLPLPAGQTQASSQDHPPKSYSEIFDEWMHDDPTLAGQHPDHPALAEHPQADPNLRSDSLTLQVKQDAGPSSERPHHDIDPPDLHDTTPSLKLHPDEKVLHYKNRREQNYPWSKFECTETKDGVSCQTRFMTSQVLDDHKADINHQELETAAMRNPPGGKNEKTKRFECGIGDCKKNYQTKRDMQKHQDSVTHPNTLYECPYLACGAEPFPSVENLSGHRYDTKHVDGRPLFRFIDPNQASNSNPNHPGHTAPETGEHSGSEQPTIQVSDKGKGLGKQIPHSLERSGSVSEHHVPAANLKQRGSEQPTNSDKGKGEEKQIPHPPKRSGSFSEHHVPANLPVKSELQTSKSEGGKPTPPNPPASVAGPPRKRKRS